MNLIKKLRFQIGTSKLAIIPSPSGRGGRAFAQAGEGFIILFLICSLSACAPSEQEKAISDQMATSVESSDEAIAPPSREAVFVYSDHSKDGPTNISLQLNAEPIQISSVYVRLAGVIEGVNPVALVEVGGKGFSVRRGEKVKEYRVISILPQEINLRRIDGQENV